MIEHDGIVGKVEKWRVGSPSGHNANIIYDHQTGDGVAEIYGLWKQGKLSEVKDDPRCAEALARAYKMAAAPAMLAALKGLMCPSGGIYGTQERIEAAMDAIRAAEGGGA